MPRYWVTVTLEVTADDEEKAEDAVNDAMSIIEPDPTLGWRWVETSADAIQEGE